MRTVIMTKDRIVSEAVDAMSACIMYYCDTRINQNKLQQIKDILMSEDVQQSESHKEYSENYNKYVSSEE